MANSVKKLPKKLPRKMMDDEEMDPGMKKKPKKKLPWSSQRPLPKKKGR